VELEEGTHPSSINCRPERSEGPPIIGKGEKTPSQLIPKKTFYCVIANEVRNLLILERGFHPLSNFSPKAKIILIPSHSEGFSPRNLRRFMFLGGVRGGKRGDPSERHFGVTAPDHFERSEKSPLLCFHGGVLRG